MPDPRMRQVLTRGGARLQSGIPTNARRARPGAAYGLLVRGVVTATYVTDDPPPTFRSVDIPRGVYCDVLVYSDIPGLRYQPLYQVPVRQDRGNMHGGRVWKPRAATIDIGGSDLDVQRATEPANMDGEHVLIGFVDDSLVRPIILGGVYHPAVDTGNDDNPVGQRLRLKLADGDPDFWRHHGSYYGVSTDGDFEIDTTRANNGTIQSGGTEPAPPTDGSGSHYYRLPADATRETELLDMGDPDNPEQVVLEQLTKDQFMREIVDKVTQLVSSSLWELLLAEANARVNVQADGGRMFEAQGKEGAATLTVGDGAVHMAIAEHMQTLWTSLKAQADAHDLHVHASAMGPTATPVPPLVCPPWSSAINSTKISTPDG